MHVKPELFCVFSISGKLIGEYESTAEIADNFQAKEADVMNAVSSETILNRKYYVFKKK